MPKYDHSDVAWIGVDSHIRKLIVEGKATRILEVGAGANPLFDIQFVRAHGLDYTLLDISSTELAKAPDGYHKVVADITSGQLTGLHTYDFIFSRMLAEHVKDGEAFHLNIFKLLAPGGRAFHFFPTLYSMPFVVNRLLPERLAELLLGVLQRGREREGRNAKFPAYYSWCRGPTPGQITRLQRLGYHIEDYVGFFGNAGYYQRLPLLKKLNVRLARWMCSNPIPQLTAFAFLTLKRPAK